MIILIVMGRLIYKVWCQIFWMKQIHRTVTTVKGMSEFNDITLRVGCTVLQCVLFIAVELNDQKYIIFEVVVA